MLARFGRFGHPHSYVIHALFFGTSAILLAAVAWAAPDTVLTNSVHMRLVAAAGRDHGTYRAAAEIELPAQAITYWRDPGEAGVPPKFSFEGSENVATADVLYPVPSRLDEDGVEAFGYRGGAAFPIHVTPQDASKPAVLKLQMDYAVCQQICVPVRSDAELVLPQNDDAANTRIAAAEARVPVNLAPAERQAKATIILQRGTEKPTWVLTWKGDDLEDLFIEAPTGWYFEPRKINAHDFSITAADAPRGAAAKSVDVRVTAATRSRPYEFHLTLDPTDVTLR